MAAVALLTPPHHKLADNTTGIWFVLAQATSKGSSNGTNCALAVFFGGLVLNKFPPRDYRSEPLIFPHKNLGHEDKGVKLLYRDDLAARPNTSVFAVVRNARASIHLASAIAGLNNVHVLEADVTDYPSLQNAAKKISHITGGNLDYLIHNAARMETDSIYKGFDDFASMDELDQDFITSYKVNALGAIHSIAACLPLLRAAPTKKIVVISTGGADPKMVRAMDVAGMAAYSVTKAAALLATTKWAAHLKSDGFVVVSLSPGLVDTTGTMGESGDPEALAIVVKAAELFKAKGTNVTLQTPEESVADQLKVIDGLKPSDNGAFLAHTGREWAI